MTYVIEGLYLGGLSEACQKDDLIDKGITHILTIDSRPLTASYYQGFTYKCVLALDMENTDLLAHFDECIMFISEGRASGGVLVHCYAGQSRSATAVLAYLMQKLDLTLDDASSMVRRQRSQIRPNPGFQEQLELFESMGKKVNKNDSLYKIYRLRNIANKIQRASAHQVALDEVCSADPSLKPEPGTVVYKCKKCRRALFRQSSILPHETGIGDAAFDWRGKVTASDSHADSVCSSSLFIEPVHWMSHDLHNMEGKLLCPKCDAKLGSFNWIGERCPCGTWVIPAFHIQSSKVDKCLPRLPTSATPTVSLSKLAINDATHQNPLVSPVKKGKTSGLTMMATPDGVEGATTGALDGK